jgi:hypothetical protein
MKKPDPDYSQEARVEDDFVQPLTPVKSASHRRLPAALPIALAGILVVSAMAFGAGVVTPFLANATPVVVGDDEPEATPTAEVVEPTDEVVAPTDAPVGDLTLEAAIVSGKVKLTWSAFNGDGFAYYKVVRSSDATVEWPLGEGDKLIAAVSDQAKLSITDSAPSGTTVFYRVFAVKDSEEGYAVITSSPAVSIDTPEATPKPTAPPVDNPYAMGPITAKDNGDGTYTLTWAPYDGPIDFSYYKLSGTESASGAFGYCEDNGYWAAIGTGTHTWTGVIEPGTWRIKVEAVYYTSEGQVLPNCETTCQKAGETSILKLTVGGEKPTAPPQVGLTLTATVVDGTVQLNWSKYTGPYFQYYLVLRSETITDLTNENYTDVWQIGSAGTLSMVDDSVVAGHTYYYRVLAWTSRVFCGGGTILGISNVETVTLDI